MNQTNIEKYLPQVGTPKNPATDSDRVKALVVGADPMDVGSPNGTFTSVISGEGQTISRFKQNATEMASLSSGASIATGRDREEWAPVNTECGKLREELLSIRAQIKVMSAACLKQKNISQAVKDGIRSIEKHADNAVHCQEKILLCAQRRGYVQIQEDGRDTETRGVKRKKGEQRTSESTPAKKTRQEGRKEREWTEVIHKRAYKKLESGRRGSTQNAAPPSRQKQKTAKSGKRQGLGPKKADAILVKPANGKSYADVLRQIRETGQNLSLRGAPRKTKDGSILLMLEKGQQLKELHQRIQGALGDNGQVRDLTSKVTLEVLDLDCLATPEEVKDALQREAESTLDIKVHVFEPNSREQCMAVAEMDQDTATKLLKKGRLKVGYISGCRVRLRTAVTRCYRCLGYGHKKAACKGPDRSRSCWKCGKEDHKSAACQARPDRVQCYLCQESGKPAQDLAHYPGSGSCAAFRAHLQDVKKRR